MVHDEKKGELTKFLLPKGWKRNFTIDLGDFRIKIGRGYRGPIRNDFTLMIYSKNYTSFIITNESLIKTTFNLPKFPWSGYKENTWCNVAQVVTSVANMKDIEKVNEDGGVNDTSYKLGEKLCYEAFYVSSYRYQTFITEVMKTLGNPTTLFDAVKRDGLLTNNVPPWDTFYFFIYCGKQAYIPFQKIVTELEKFNDYHGFDNLDYRAIETFFDAIEVPENN